MSYTEKIFGVKLRGCFVAVEEADIFGDISKYDYLLKDCLEDSYNGNYHYRIDVMTEVGKEAFINGWKLQKIDMPGNWFGQRSYFILNDKFGDTYSSPQPVIKEMWYDKQPIMVIRETLLEVLNFTNKNHSAKYAHIVEGLDIPSACYSIDELRKFSAKVEKYISEYQDVLKLLKEEGASEYEEYLTQCFFSQLSKCYSFEIKRK